ncbi:hypothetical protein TVAG_370810 [Trichomonas vaginalis G3]|uniref:Late endosomal/lysosomal adaptor and MAPK and MTOR activator 5 n=1 Tax=Trichomonas vaginalis (strain ATCC PRA-98 / G3) TaxID=412133 RepID=A2FHN3_TRIV3|nr:hypothetical protein TVAGG3_0946660 [Trichomonas vaginalis G3]EAX95577.1 hypothetical protein TVAG_370810 [Trichomonas vaginalis G3]KAI5486923.1 hypothetical protein TVAGG3_0946660 [Trichomonas vaginalis G3]|eukprot:XP_001308507.1 hypothetical protein [Trichomonas vaginalis G3]
MNQEMMTNEKIITFDIAIDGSIHDVQGELEGVVIDPLLIHRLMDNAQKALIDEEVVTISVTTKQYLLRITANGAKYSCIVKMNR